mmetsp:Transcript_27665/g.30979  ORF Transcript_27665/g.30979 Transcript_27665/m.30979 type:complete len:102 (-) Transcript_27665:354-659(-)
MREGSLTIKMDSIHFERPKRKKTQEKEAPHRESVSVWMLFFSCIFSLGRGRGGKRLTSSVSRFSHPHEKEVEKERERVLVTRDTVWIGLGRYIDRVHPCMC